MIFDISSVDEDGCVHTYQWVFVFLGEVAVSSRLGGSLDLGFGVIMNPLGLEKHRPRCMTPEMCNRVSAVTAAGAQL